MTATTSRPAPRPPATRPVYVTPATDVAAALAHRTRRSTQELGTALLEVKDAASAVVAICPLTPDTTVLPAEERARIDAVHLRFDNAVIRAVAAGATTHQLRDCVLADYRLDDPTNGAPR